MTGQEFGPPKADKLILPDDRAFFVTKWIDRNDKTTTPENAFGAVGCDKDGNWCAIFLDGFAVQRMQ